MNVFAKFYEIPLMILEVIKETKRYRHTVGRSDNVKTVYPPTNTVCGGYNNNHLMFCKKKKAEQASLKIRAIWSRSLMSTGMHIFDKIWLIDS